MRRSTDVKFVTLNFFENSLEIEVLSNNQSGKSEMINITRAVNRERCFS